MAEERPIFYSKVEVDTDDPRELLLVRTETAAKSVVPRELRVFSDEIDSVARTATSLFEKDLKRRKKFFELLHLAASTGLCGPNWNLEAGESDLGEAKKAIANEFPVIRDSLWWWYFAMLLFIVPILGATGGALYYGSVTGKWGLPKPQIDPSQPSGHEIVFNVLVAIAIAFLWIPVGAVVGLFVEFVFQMGDKEVSFEDLQSINPGRWRPLQRMVNTTITAYCLATLMGFQAFQVGVGNILLNDFISSKPYLATAVGFVSGIAFPYVRDIVSQFKPIRTDSKASSS